MQAHCTDGMEILNYEVITWARERRATSERTNNVPTVAGGTQKHMNLHEAGAHCQLAPVEWTNRCASA